MLRPLHLIQLVATTAIAATVFGVSHYTEPLGGPRRLSDRAFSETMSTLSEPALPFHPSGGYQSDNWVSNERSTQQALPQLHPHPGGAYIGVGPDYISNVESCLRGTQRDQFITNVRALPRDANSLVIGTIFHSTGDTAGKANYVTSTATFPLASVWD